MLLQLAERGVVTLTDPVEKYLPEINRLADRPKDAAPVTFEQVATMMSGIAREPDDMNTFLVGAVDNWEQVLLAALPKTKYAQEPGKGYLYSNIGYAILGASLGRAAKQSYVEYVRESVLRPLGMTTTDFVPTAVIQPVLAKGYNMRDGKPDGEQPAREHAGRGYKVPNGALYTTVGDLAKFVGLWLGEGPETVLKRATIEDAFTRVPSGATYGIGFMVRRVNDSTYYGHGGSVAGYLAHMQYHRPSKTGVIVLRNIGGGPFNPANVANGMLTMALSGR
jgi:CubicO group peptidase (beta-lactamase class C family)